MDLFILGAGASRGVLSGKDVVPTSAEFGEILCRVKPNWTTEYPALFKVVEHLGLCRDKWPLEDVWSCLDWYAKLQPALPKPKPWNDESRQLKKALLAVFGKRCDSLSEVANDSTLANILRDDVKSGDTLVSFNYDTIAERLAARLGCQLDARPRGGAGVAFAKPHGSASWTLDLCKRSVDWLSLDGTPLVTSLRTDHVDVGREPLVLGAVPIKSELIREVQTSCGIPLIYDVVACQWRVLVEAVRDAKRIVLVGYRFPAEDLYGRFLIKEGLRLRRNSVAIQYYELRKVCCEIKKVFGDHATSIEYMGCVLEHST
jgi:hypothetical protein